MTVFPGLSAEQVHAAVAAKWDLSGPVPLPKPGWLACPVCRAPGPQPRWFKFHERPAPATVRHRCDVSFKCVDCSAVWLHGVPLDAAYYRARARRPRQKLPWREVRRLLEEEG